MSSVEDTVCFKGTFEKVVFDVKKYLHNHTSLSEFISIKTSVQLSDKLSTTEQ